jgi:Core-2/I-Branching enzyme
MRIAFLILNHRAPTQLLRLINTIRRELPDSPIVVHHDEFAADLSRALLDFDDNAFLLTTGTPISWGDFGVVDAYWQCLSWMCENVDFDYVVLLSGQDYPIKPLGLLAADLAATGADIVVKANPIDKLSRRKQRVSRRRYFYQYRPARTAPRPSGTAARPSGTAARPSGTAAWPSRARCWLRRRAGIAVDVLNNVQPFFHVYKFSDQQPWWLGRRPRRTPFTAAEPCWFGSMWLTLSRRAAGFVVASVRDRPDFVDYYRRTAHSDESATATLVCNAPWARVERRDLHYVRWTDPRAGHPDVFRAEDLPELLAAPGYFARKFDIATDARILDELDQMLAQAAVAAVAETARRD